MTEQQIETLVERRMDALDRTYLSTAMTEAEYERQIKAIDVETRRLLERV